MNPYHKAIEIVCEAREHGHSMDWVIIRLGALAEEDEQPSEMMRALNQLRAQLDLEPIEVRP